MNTIIYEAPESQTIRFLDTDLISASGISGKDPDIGEWDVEMWIAERFTSVMIAWRQTKMLATRAVMIGFAKLWEALPRWKRKERKDNNEKENFVI